MTCGWLARIVPHLAGGGLAPRCVLLLLGLAALTAPLPAQSSWVGEQVVVTKPHDQIQFGDRVGGRQVYYKFSGKLLIKVRAERDGWLRIHDDQHEGWVNKDDFILARDAPAYFTQRVQANPKDAWALYMRASGWLQRGELDNAIRDYDEVIRLVPTEAPAFNCRGLAWQRKKAYDQAIRDYGEAIRLDAKHAYYFNNRGNSWLLKKEYDQALSDFDEATRLDPKLALAFSNRGNTWNAKKDHDKAIRDLDEAIRLDPKFAFAFNIRGVVWLAKKQYDQAFRDLDEAIRLDPKDAFAFNDRGRIWHAKKEFDKAIRDFDEAIRLDPKVCYGYGNRACAWAKLEQGSQADGSGNRGSPVVKVRHSDRAVADFERAFKLDPIDWVHREYAFFRASCADPRYRDGKKAVELARKAIELAGPDTDWRYWSTLAAAYAETGDFTLAVAEQEKALTDQSLDREDRARMEKRLSLYRDQKPYRDEE